MKLPVPRFAFIILFVALIGYAVYSLRGPKGVAALLEKQRQIEQLEKRNAALAQEVERKRERIKRLGESPSEQELEIRQRLKLARPGEKIFIVGEPEAK